MVVLCCGGGLVKRQKQLQEPIQWSFASLEEDEIYGDAIEDKSTFVD